MTNEIISNKDLIDSLADEAKWITCSSEVTTRLKAEMQTRIGFIRKIKDRCESERVTKINSLFMSLNGAGVAGLDNKIDALASGIQEANDAAIVRLLYDIFCLLDDVDSVEYPFLASVKDYLADSSNDVARYRLFSAVAITANQSLSQGKKSNAGVAGEMLVRAALSAVGLERDVHYREQFKSAAGSDTDFVFPCIPDKADPSIEVAVAVQMSSNDRIRLTSSELKPGANGYVFTGNGLAASSKSLRDIGSQLINKAIETNTRMVCFGPEIEKEKERLKCALAIKEDEDLRKRLRYFENSALSIEKFVEKMSRYL